MHFCMGETGHWNKRWLEMGLSRMKGNFHVRFLGGERAAMPLATLYNRLQLTISSGSGGRIAIWLFVFILYLSIIIWLRFRADVFQKSRHRKALTLCANYMNMSLFLTCSFKTIRLLEPCFHQRFLDLLKINK